MPLSNGADTPLYPDWRVSSLCSLLVQCVVRSVLDTTCHTGTVTLDDTLCVLGGVGQCSGTTNYGEPADIPTHACTMSGQQAAVIGGSSVWHPLTRPSSHCLHGPLTPPPTPPHPLTDRYSHPGMPGQLLTRTPLISNSNRPIIGLFVVVYTPPTCHNLT